MNIRGVAAASQSGHRGQIAAVAAHYFDDEEPPLGSGGRLPNPVANLSDLVERGVAAEGELRAGDVVADRRGQDDDGDVEFRELGPVFGHQEGGVVGLKATDEEETVNVLLRQRPGSNVSKLFKAAIYKLS